MFRSVRIALMAAAVACTLAAPVFAQQPPEGEPPAEGTPMGEPIPAPHPPAGPAMQTICVIECVPERHGHRALRERGDFLLCHHWQDVDTFRRFKGPRVFWCFDLISYPDRTLRALVAARPRSEAALSQVAGIGPTKLERYGREILALLGS